jgi:mannose-1-phosphate guanylyltransferase
VTFGVTPDRPETGYGYLELDGARTAPAVPLKSFREKPDLETAQAMLASGGYLWNAGIFLMRVGDLIAAFETHAPDMIAPCRSAIDRAPRIWASSASGPRPMARPRRFPSTTRSWSGWTVSRPCR